MRRFGCSLMAAVALTACGDAEHGQNLGNADPAREDVATIEQASAGYDSSVQLWPNVVNVCLMNPNTPPADRAVMQAALANSWQVNSGLTFNWLGDCPLGSTNPNVMPISYIMPQNGGQGGGKCNPGRGGARIPAGECQAAAGCQCYFIDYHFLDSDPNFDGTRALSSIIIHEVGHGLGVPHEHQRADRPAYVGNNGQGSVAGEPQRCPDPSAATCCPDQLNLTNKWTTNDNFLKLPNLKLLTLYDAKFSVMSYCRDVDGNGLPGDVNGTSYFSGQDALGIEMMYPKSFGRKPVMVGGFGDGAGSQYVVRSDTPVGLRVDWVARGAMPTMSASPGDPTHAFHDVQWKGTAGTISTQLSPNLVISSAQTIQVQLVDAYYRAHPLTGVAVVPSNAKWTAIQGTAMVALL
jgi:hypothetical protein